MQPSYTTFKGISNYNDMQLLSEIENNLKYWIDWSLLCIGGWTNVTTGNINAKSGSPGKLNWVKDASYTSGQVWQTPRKDLVWESGVDYNSNNPINISGIYINSTLSTTGYNINYPMGYVVFTTAQSITGNIYMNYSYRNVQVSVASNTPWWNLIQFGSSDDSNSIFAQDPTNGDWSIGSYKRIQLPAIIIEAVPRGTSKGYELGNGALIVEQDVVFHILADNRSTRNNLTSMLFLQNDKVLWLFDSNIINSGQVFPLNYRGNRINSLLYPNLVSETGYRWKRCTLTKTNMSEVESIYPNLYEGIVRTTLELVFGDI